MEGGVGMQLGVLTICQMVLDKIMTVVSMHTGNDE